MIDKKVHYVFHKYQNFGQAPDVVVSTQHHRDDALFEFVFETLGYAILEIETEKETAISAKEV